MYGRLARYYDGLYAWKDYAGEAEQLHALLGELGVADGARVVEAACGTGLYLTQLSRWYRVAGYDGSAEMLAVARDKLVGVDLQRALLQEHVVSPAADAVVCLFSSIGHVPRPELPAVARCLRDSVRPGGVVIVEPWIAPQIAESGHVAVQTHTAPGVALSRVSLHDVVDGRSKLDFAFTLATPKGVERLDEVHWMELLEPSELTRIFERAGLLTEWHDPGLGRGLLVARRPG
jgi:daunosaminyl-N,N-dimethyltransferase/N-dimethyltransferase